MMAPYKMVARFQDDIVAGTHQEEKMKKIKILHEELGDIAVALEALVGTLIMSLAIAIALRVASGKW